MKLSLPPLYEGDRFGTPLLVEPRLGQGTFRVAVTDAYGRAYAFTGEKDRGFYPRCRLTGAVRRALRGLGGSVGWAGGLIEGLRLGGGTRRGGPVRCGRDPFHAPLRDPDTPRPPLSPTHPPKKGGRFRW